MGTWHGQTERPCLSTRDPRNRAFIWPSMAVAIAIGMLRDAQRTRADTCKRTRPRSCTKPWRDGIATTPTNHPKRGNQADYMRERGSMRACRREFSERIAGLEARLGVATNEHESSLDAGGRVALRGHLRRTPSGKLALRRPARPWPPVSKPTSPLKSTSRETRPETCTF